MSDSMRSSVNDRVDYEQDVCGCTCCQAKRNGENDPDTHSPRPPIELDDLPDPDLPTREYLVTAVLQLVVRESSKSFAIISVKDTLNEIIADSEFSADPMNGAIVEAVEDLTASDLQDEFGW